MPEIKRTGLSPLMLPELVCPNDGTECKVTHRRNQHNQIVESFALCGTCKTKFQLFLTHINATQARWTKEDDALFEEPKEEAKG